MTCANNQIILENCIDSYKTENELNLSSSEIFELFIASQITKKYNLSFEDIFNSIVDGGLDGGIDSIIILINDEAVDSEEDVNDSLVSEKSCLKLICIQSKTEKSHTESTFDKLLANMPLIFDLDSDIEKLSERFNTCIVSKTMIFRESWKRAIAKRVPIYIDYIYACKSENLILSPSFHSKIKQLKELTMKAVNGSIVDIKCLSSKEMLDIYREVPTTKLTLKFKESPIPITYKDDKQIGYIGVVKLGDYYGFITDSSQAIRENIFEYNVRHYQGAIDVNKKIMETVVSGQDKDFWWLNNGITIIASNAAPFGKELTLENPKIVNGLQTSYVIGKNYDYNTADERAILLKVIVSNDKKAIDEIISATNSQTPVTSAVLRATDDLQRNIEEYLLTKGYYYDRRKNFYKNLKKPAAKIFGIQYMAQAIESIINISPSTARSKPTSLMKNNSTYNNIFKSNVDYSAYLNCCIICRESDNYTRNKLTVEMKSVVRNFTLHLARIFTSVILNKAFYGPNDIAKINTTSLDEKSFSEAAEQLLNAIESYQNKTNENIINIAKSQRFDVFINDQIKTRLSSGGTLFDK